MKNQLFISVCERSTHRDDSFECTLTVHLVTDVVVGADQSHTCILHTVYVIFI